MRATQVFYDHTRAVACVRTPIVQDNIRAMHSNARFFGSGDRLSLLGRFLGADTSATGGEVASCLGDCRLDSTGSSETVQGGS